MGETYKKRRRECISGREDSVGQGMEAESYLMLTGDSEENYFGSYPLLSFHKSQFSIPEQVANGLSLISCSLMNAWLRLEIWNHKSPLPLIKDCGIQLDGKEKW